MNFQVVEVIEAAKSMPVRLVFECELNASKAEQTSITSYIFIRTVYWIYIYIHRATSQICFSLQGSSPLLHDQGSMPLGRRPGLRSPGIYVLDFLDGRGLFVTSCNHVATCNELCCQSKLFHGEQQHYRSISFCASAFGCLVCLYP